MPTTVAAAGPKKKGGVLPQVFVPSMLAQQEREMKRMEWIERRSRGLSPGLDSVSDGRKPYPSIHSSNPYDGLGYPPLPMHASRATGNKVAVSLPGLTQGQGPSGTAQSARGRGSKVQLPSIHSNGIGGVQMHRERNMLQGTAQSARSGGPGSPSYCPVHLRDIIHQLPPTVVQALATLRGETAVPFLPHGGHNSTTALPSDIIQDGQEGQGFGVESAIGTQIGVLPASIPSHSTTTGMSGVDPSYLPLQGSRAPHGQGQGYGIATGSEGRDGTSSRAKPKPLPSSTSSSSPIHPKAFHEEVMLWNADDLYQVEHFQ